MQSSREIKRRARQACDACRARKIKCQYDDRQSDSCIACGELGVICAKETPRKRRGPKSRYAETQKSRQEDMPGPSVSIATSVSTFPTLDSFAPLLLINQILTDWFELIHSLAPILHRASFLHALQDTEHSTRRGFVALVVAVCAATSASLRRRTYDEAVTTEGCYEFLLKNSLIPRSTDISLESSSICYHLSVALGTERGIDNGESQMLLHQATAGVQYLVHYELNELTRIEQEMAKRLYWLCYAAQCTLGLLGRPMLASPSPRASFDTMQLLNVNDLELDSSYDQQDPWHGNFTSYIPGLLIQTSIFILWQESQQEYKPTMAKLQSHLQRAEFILDSLPPELRWRGGLSRPARANFGTDVQMVNLYITQIHVRGFLLDEMIRLARSSDDESHLSSIITARQNLVDDMLAIVYQVSEDILEANGIGLVNKLRDIGLTLLNNPDGNSSRAIQNLERLLAKLDKLDTRPRGSQTDSTSPFSVMTPFSARIQFD